MEALTDAGLTSDSHDDLEIESLDPASPRGECDDQVAEPPAEQVCDDSLTEPDDILSRPPESTLEEPQQPFAALSPGEQQAADLSQVGLRSASANGAHRMRVPIRIATTHPASLLPSPFI